MCEFEHYLAENAVCRHSEEVGPLVKPLYSFKPNNRAAERLHRVSSPLKESFLLSKYLPTS